MHSVRLNYAFRTGALTGIAGHRPIYLFAHTTPAHVLEWAKQQEIRPGACTLFDYGFDLPEKSGTLTQSPRLPIPSGRVLIAGPSGAPTCDAPRLVRRFLVDDGAGGCFIHGWPPCRCARCIVLPHGIEEMVSVAGSVGTLTIIS
jgi:hypothetical protein